MFCLLRLLTLSKPCLSQLRSKLFVLRTNWQAGWAGAFKKYGIEFVKVECSQNFRHFCAFNTRYSQWFFLLFTASFGYFILQ